jgi:group I intron endonuclease
MTRAGVYAIRNSINGKTYVGTSLNIPRRWREHRKHLRDRNHINAHLQAAWNQYGEGAFVFSVLAVVANADELSAGEAHWISLLQTADPDKGYNLRLDPCTNRGLSANAGEKNNHSRLASAQVIEIRRRLLAGERQRTIAAQFGVAEKTVNSIRLGQSWRHVTELRDEVTALPTSGGPRNNRGVRNPKARLTEADVVQIRALLAAGQLAQAEIARQFGVVKQTIWRIKHGVQWHTDSTNA